MHEYMLLVLSSQLRIIYMYLTFCQVLSLALVQCSFFSVKPKKGWRKSETIQVWRRWKPHIFCKQYVTIYAKRTRTRGWRRRKNKKGKTPKRRNKLFESSVWLILSDRGIELVDRDRERNSNSYSLTSLSHYHHFLTSDEFCLRCPSECNDNRTLSI